MRLFIDANLLFSAAHRPSGAVGRFFHACHDLRWELVTSDYALQEAERNLQRKSPAALRGLAALLRIVRVLDAANAPCPAPLRDKDQPILAAAIACSVDYLLTGDVRDFGPYLDNPGATGGVCVMTVAGFIEHRMKA